MALAACASPKTDRTRTKSGANAEAGIASTDLLLVEALRQYINHRDPAQALAIAQLAVQRSPERIDATWLLLQICAGAQGCQPQPLEARLRKLDPANGMVWLGALGRATKGGDTAAENQILEAIGRSERVDLYWNGLVAKLTAALAERTRTTTPTSNMPLSDSLNETVGLVSQVAVSAFQPLADSCSAPRLFDKLVSARCLLVGAVLQRSDTYIAESMGLGIAQRLAASDSAETDKVERRITLSRYQRDTAGEVITAQVERDRFATQLLGLMRKLRREQDVFIAIIRWAGRPLTPPPER
jgi:hypothetical protein